MGMTADPPYLPESTPPISRTIRGVPAPRIRRRAGRSRVDPPYLPDGEGWVVETPTRSSTLRSESRKGLRLPAGRLLRSLLPASVPAPVIRYEDQPSCRRFLGTRWRESAGQEDVRDRCLYARERADMTTTSFERTRTFEAQRLRARLRAWCRRNHRDAANDPDALRVVVPVVDEFLDALAQWEEEGGPTEPVDRAVEVFADAWREADRIRQYRRAPRSVRNRIRGLVR